MKTSQGLTGWRNNIRVKGIPESTEWGTWQYLEAKVKEASKTKLDLDVNIERAHRVDERGKNYKKHTHGPENQQRTIVCRLLVNDSKDFFSLREVK